MTVEHIYATIAPMKLTIKANQSLLEALAELSPGSSKTTMRSWLHQGRVTVDSIIVKEGSARVHTGQVVALRGRNRYLEEGVLVYFEDGEIVVIDKPAGLLTVATNFEKDITAHAILKEHFKPIFVVHRLDQDTSGVMLFARSEKAEEKLKAEFEKHSIERIYIAIVEGHVTPSSGSWKSYLHEDANYVVHSTQDPQRGRLAVTHYEVIASSRRYSLLRMTLETGRKNQIRVHCTQAGHPVAGDKKYGAKSNPIKRLCLHSNYLQLEHPITQKWMRFESPVPTEFSQLVT